jgi:hypothetical protein
MISSSHSSSLDDDCRKMALDGGFAGTVFNVVPRPSIADGGGSSSRHGVSDPVYDGSSGEDYVLDGGGA